MKMSVVGFDPSLTHWGIAHAELDLTTGFLEKVRLTLVEPVRLTTKQVRQNSKDLHETRQLATAAFAAARGAEAVFVEVPVGSQSARAMASYGICVGVLGSILAESIELIEVTASEVKEAFTGNRSASKEAMIAQAVSLYPGANYPRYTKNGKTYKKGDIMTTAEHVADALGAIHAGVNTPLFQNLMRLYTNSTGANRADHHRPGRDRTGHQELHPLADQRA